MRGRWFADPADGERLDETLLWLVGATSRMLDGLGPSAVAPGAGPASPSPWQVVRSPTHGTKGDLEDRARARARHAVGSL